MIRTVKTGVIVCLLIIITLCILLLVACSIVFHKLNKSKQIGFALVKKFTPFTKVVRMLQATLAAVREYIKKITNAMCAVTHTFVQLKKKLDLFFTDAMLIDNLHKILVAYTVCNMFLIFAQVISERVISKRIVQPFYDYIWEPLREYLYTDGVDVLAILFPQMFGLFVMFMAFQLGMATGTYLAIYFFY